LIDRIANALPKELRADYYRELAHCRNLPESDEMLRILRAMQFLTVLIESAPSRVAVEREQLAEVLTGAIASMTTMHQASVAYQQRLEARLAKLPEEIARGISAEAIAAKLTESAEAVSADWIAGGGGCGRGACAQVAGRGRGIFIGDAAFCGSALRSGQARQRCCCADEGESGQR
jgi:hypothetical protein